MSDEIIEIDTERGKQFGLTSDKFMPITYLWKTGDKIYISMIECQEKGKGYFSNLLKEIWKQGYKVAVPTPMSQMQEILCKKKFKVYQEGEYEVWIK
jgi:hypothetical protein